MPMEYYAGTLAAGQNFRAYRTMHIHLETFGLPLAVVKDDGARN